jgi:diketogulonate reductase-like aldo/keto reductase
VANPRISMNDGRSLPALGFGVYQSAPGQETRGATLHALKSGYRHLDTAQAYRNEKDVGAALRESGLPRADVFVTTKIATANTGYELTKKSLDRSLQQFGGDYFDLVLIHFPVTGRRLDTWRALVEAQREGKARSIGVSNFTVRHLEELLATTDVRPAVNQVELSPFLQQRELRAFCARHDIVVEAYSPLTQGKRLGHPTLVEVAQRVGRTPAQTMLRWALQHQLVVLPKSVTPARIEENAAIFDFELPPAELQRLDGLEEGLRVCWDPTDVP